MQVQFFFLCAKYGHAIFLLPNIGKTCIILSLLQFFAARKTDFRSFESENLSESTNFIQFHDVTRGSIYYATISLHNRLPCVFPARR